MKKSEQMPSRWLDAVAETFLELHGVEMTALHEAQAETLFASGASASSAARRLSPGIHYQEEANSVAPKQMASSRRTPNWYGYRW